MRFLTRPVYEKAAEGGSSDGEEAKGGADPAGDVNKGGEPARFGQESARFRQSEPEIPDGLPERFLKDGKPDWSNLTKSYVELDRAFKTKTEDLKEQLKGELFKDRPESADKYEVPAGLDADAPILGWWKEQAHTMGLSQDQFQEGVNKFVEYVGGSVDIEAEVAKLGDNGKARIDAVTAWAQKNFTDPEEFRVLELIGTSAKGIIVLEKLMGGAELNVSDNNDVPAKSLTEADLRKMQGDPRYWDPTRRDPSFVKQIEEGWRNLTSK